MVSSAWHTRVARWSAKWVTEVPGLSASSVQMTSVVWPRRRISRSHLEEQFRKPGYSYSDPLAEGLDFLGRAGMPDQPAEGPASAGGKRHQVP